MVNLVTAAAQPHGRLWFEFLPAYVPELNPVEYLWSPWKATRVTQLLSHTFWAVESLRARLRRMRRRPALAIPFWQQADLFPL